MNVRNKIVSTNLKCRSASVSELILTSSDPAGLMCLFELCSNCLETKILVKLIKYGMPLKKNSHFMGLVLLRSFK